MVKWLNFSCLYLCNTNICCSMMDDLVDVWFWTTSSVCFWIYRLTINFLYCFWYMQICLLSKIYLIHLINLRLLACKHTPDQCCPVGYHLKELLFYRLYFVRVILQFSFSRSLMVLLTSTNNLHENKIHFFDLKIIFKSTCFCLLRTRLETGFNNGNEVARRIKKW